MKHRIDTGDAAPVSKGYIRMGKPYAERLRKVLDEQLRWGWIRRSRGSPWSAAALLVPKKDGNDRLVIDYRGLNAVKKRIGVHCLALTI